MSTNPLRVFPELCCHGNGDIRGRRTTMAGYRITDDVVSVCQAGTVTVWMIDTGQKVKQFSDAHTGADVTTLSQDHSETRLFTGSTDGTVKMWDFNGHCYHTLHCQQDGQPADVGMVLALKRTVLIIGWARYIAVFRNPSFKDFHVVPSDWKGGQEHADDILALAFSPPNTLASASYDGEIIVWNNSSESASRRMAQRSRKLLSLSRKTTYIGTRENTMVTDGGFNSHEYEAEKPRTRPKSRANSRISTGSEDETNEYGYAVTRLAFLDGRRGNSASAGANLVSCGGNGWVRFWNTAHASLLAEFVAHTQVGSIIMAVDSASQWLVTGDVDGLIKSWNISEYCLHGSDQLVTDPPLMNAQWQPHVDMVVSIEICMRNERTLVISASSDCSVALCDIYGNLIGVFGQENHWKIEPYVPKEEQEEEQEEEESNSDQVEVVPDDKSEWEPDDQATMHPAEYRINTWDSTVLGKDYQELRVRKRERRQPEVIDGLAYLHWEKTGQAPAGPYAALETSTLDPVDQLKKPDFMSNPHKYFSERASSAEQEQPNQLPALNKTLKASFDEKNLFPKSLLDFEARMKIGHQQVLKDMQKKVVHEFSKTPGVAGGSNLPQGTSAARRPTFPIKPNKLRPVQPGVKTE